MEIVTILVYSKKEFNQKVKELFIPALRSENNSDLISGFIESGLLKTWTTFFYTQDETEVIVNLV